MDLKKCIARLVCIVCALPALVALGIFLLMVWLIAPQSGGYGGSVEGFVLIVLILFACILIMWIWQTAYDTGCPSDPFRVHPAAATVW